MALAIDLWNEPFVGLQAESSSLYGVVNQARAACGGRHFEQSTPRSERHNNNVSLETQTYRVLPPLGCHRTSCPGLMLPRWRAGEQQAFHVASAVAGLLERIMPAKALDREIGLERQ